MLGPPENEAIELSKRHYPGGVERMTLGKMQNPVRGFLHGAAALASVVGLVTLIVRAAPNRTAVWSVIVFGLSLIALYTTSSLYHSVPWTQRWKARFQRLDHAMILVLVAGSWTPVAVLALTGTLRTVTLTVVWGAAAVGVVQKFAWPKVRVWFTIALATSMGWFVVVTLPQIARRLSLGAILLLFIGGLCYTIGMIAFATRRPRLFPRVFSYHEVFHVLVVAGSIAHFAMIMQYVVPLGA